MAGSVFIVYPFGKGQDPVAFTGTGPISISHGTQ